MSDEQNAEGAEDGPPKKKSKKLLIVLLLVPLLGGGAFYGVYSGMIPLPFGEDPVEQHSEAGEHGNEEASDNGSEKGEHTPVSQVSFIPLEEMVISLGPNAKARHLKMRVSIEVASESEGDVTAVTPRIIDMLNTFLRAVDEQDFEVPRSMLRLRAQMLRRVQLVTPKGSVRDVLIQEFVLN